jgi:hypothetical protein
MDSVPRLATATLLLTLAATSGCSVFRRQPPPTSVCSESHGLEVVSLAIYPDPLPDTRRLDEWRLRVRSDTPQECNVAFRIVEVEHDTVAAERNAFLILGVNDLTVGPKVDYQFTGDQRCFKVVAESNKTPLDVRGPKSFCAVHVDGSWWSMR